MRLLRTKAVAHAERPRTPGNFDDYRTQWVFLPHEYGVADQMLTWNYIAVHLLDQLEFVLDAKLCKVIDSLSYDFDLIVSLNPS